MAGELADAQPKPLISVAEAARRIGISEFAAHRLAAGEPLPGMVKLPGARTWVRARVLEAWLDGEDPATEDRPPALPDAHT